MFGRYAKWLPFLWTWFAWGCASEQGETSALPSGPLHEAGTDSSSCKPATCLGLGAECGKAPDGCGGVVSCGQCSGGLYCGGDGPNRCGANACVAKTCVSAGAQCGLVSNGCDDVLSCGECVAPLVCGGGGKDNQCGCRAKTCVELNAQCGMVDDGCGMMVDCGACPAGQHCGGEKPNVCGSTACVPKTCQEIGASCGIVSDGCSGTLDCGSCVSPETCGGSGVPNHCGCLKKTCDALNAQCGSVSDGCGGTLSCGDCKTGETCQANECQCANGWKPCGSQCIPNSSCCTDTDCTGDQICVGQACSCPPSTKLCGNQCIPNSSCCSDSDCSGLFVCAKPGDPCSCRTSPSRYPIYRSYRSNGDHLFSVSPDEGTPHGYTSEGVRFYVYAQPCQWGLVPLRRLYHETKVAHTCATEQSEINALVSQGWRLEGSLGCIATSADCSATALYHLIYASSDLHMFTTSVTERDYMVTAGWT
ncbi:MAG TPA: hypothetical protein PLM08_18205, partial [Polyangiaceae bacterium]|nr:hypothetical protein [Polyangiaceae bacterium]